MPAMYASEIAVTFTPTGGEGLEVCRHGDYLLAEPETAWELQTQNNDPIGAGWASDRPIGNSRRTLRVQRVVKRKDVSTLVRYLRRTENVANVRREGSLLWQEAFSGGLATYKTRWRGLVMACNVRRLTPEEVPSNDEACAWGLVEWEIQITHPTEL